MFILKWTNRYSGETGFVESISTKENHFNNTFDQTKAKAYKSKSVASRMVTSLNAMGEGDNNEFEIVAAE